jgi:hypothetical protein
VTSVLQLKNAAFSIVRMNAFFVNTNMFFPVAKMYNSLPHPSNSGVVFEKLLVTFLRLSSG